MFIARSNIPSGFVRRSEHNVVPKFQGLSAPPHEAAQLRFESYTFHSSGVKKKAS
jgi:hypothetical protein